MFVSYGRVGATSVWLQRHFIPMLGELLEYELGRPARVFYDDGGLSAGGTWPVELGQKLGRSRTLLVLWSKSYLTSQWCAREIAIMRAREVSLNLRSPENAKGTIAITIIQDGDALPPTLKMIQNFEIKDYFNTRMNPESPLAEGLYDRLKQKVPDLAEMIETAPPYRDEWPIEAAEELYELFHQRQSVSQNTRPMYTE